MIRRPAPEPRPWIGAALALALAGLTLRGPLVSPGIVGDGIEQSTGIDTGGLGLLTTIPVLLFAVAAPLGGAVVARIGARASLGIAMIVIAAGSLVRVADGAAPLFAGTVVLGLGLTLGNVAAPVLVKQRVPVERVSTTTGFYTAALNVGSVLAALGTAPLADAVGWRGALAAWALLALVAMLPWLIARGEPRRFSALSGLDLDTGRSRGSVFLMLAFAGQGLSYFALIAWLPTILSSTLDIDAGAAAHASALFQLTAIAGAVSTTPLSRLLGGSRLFVVIAVAWAALPLFLLLAPGAWWAGAALAGWAQGATVTLVFALVAERTVSLRESARLSGRVQFVGYGAGAAGPVLFEVLHALTGTWTLPLMVVVVAASAIGVGGVLAVRRLDRGPA